MHVANVTYCDTRTDIHTYTRRPAHRRKCMYIRIVALIIVEKIRINGFTIIDLVHIIYYNAIDIEVFHKFAFSSKLLYV